MIGFAILRKGPCCWVYRGVALIAKGYPKDEQLRMVDSLPDEARQRISHIHHFDDQNKLFAELQIVWIEPMPSDFDLMPWFLGRDWEFLISFGVVSDFHL